MHGYGHVAKAQSAKGLQDMIERACAPDHPYDAIIFYAFNRFFRNVAEMELTITKTANSPELIGRTARLSGSVRIAPTSVRFDSAWAGPPELAGAVGRPFDAGTC